MTSNGAEAKFHFYRLMGDVDHNGVVHVYYSDRGTKPYPSLEEAYLDGNSSIGWQYNNFGLQYPAAVQG